MRKIDGFILAGGESKRMGSPKAELRLGGLSMIERSGQALQSISDHIFVVGSSSGDHTFETLADDFDPYTPQRRAAIIGLYTALKNCRAPYAAVLACDLPFVTSRLFERLVEILISFADAGAVVPVQPDGRLQPLCAVYRPDACLTTIRAALDSDDWRLQETVASLNIRTVKFAEIADLDSSENFFFNLNTPADFDAAAKLITQQQGATGRI